MTLACLSSGVLSDSDTAPIAIEAISARKLHSINHPRRPFAETAKMTRQSLRDAISGLPAMVDAALLPPGPLGEEEPPVSVQKTRLQLQNRAKKAREAERNAVTAGVEQTKLEELKAKRATAEAAALEESLRHQRWLHSAAGRAAQAPNREAAAAKRKRDRGEDVEGEAPDPDVVEGLLLRATNAETRALVAENALAAEKSRAAKTEKKLQDRVDYYKAQAIKFRNQLGEPQSDTSSSSGSSE